MKKQLCIFLLSIVTSVGFGQTTIGYKSVVKYFFESYDYRKDTDTYPVFIKRNYNYYIAEKSSSSSDVSKEQLFWSAKKGKYIEVDYNEGIFEEKELKDKTLELNRGGYYDLNPSFGYTNYFIDVIKQLKKKEFISLSDDEIYALGRAYSTYASSLVNHNSGTSSADLCFLKKDHGKNLLTPKQLLTYRHYRHLATSYFYKLYQKTPSYETFIGNIFTKYSNEHLTSFLDLLLVQNMEEAYKELNDSIYTPFEIAYAKNTLNSCKKNSILLLSGDNDTYTCLYAQAFLKHRKDVTILNRHLFGTNNYINHFRDNQTFDAFPLKMELKKSDYSDGTLLNNKLLSRAFVDIETDSLIIAKNIYDLLKKQDKYYHFPIQFAIETKDKKFIKFTFEEEYIFKNQIALYDILISNYPERVIHFQYDGVALQNTKQKHWYGINKTLFTDPSLNSSTSPFVRAESYQFLTNQLYCPNVNSKTSAINYTIGVYTNAYFQTASSYYDKNLLDSCISLMNSFDQKIPDQLKPSIHLINLLLLSGQIDNTPMTKKWTNLYIEKLNQLIVNKTLPSKEKRYRISSLEALIKLKQPGLNEKLQSTLRALKAY